MGMAMVAALAADWQIRGCLWIGGINNPEGGNAFPLAIAWIGQGAFLLPVQSAANILAEPVIQSLLAQDGDEDPRAVLLSLGDTTAIPIPLVSGLGIRTQFQGEVNGLLMVSDDAPHPWTDKERARLEQLALIFAIATRLQTLTPEGEAAPPQTLSIPAVSFPYQVNPLMSTVYASIQKKFAEQSQLNRLKNDIITTFSHETRTPITNMSMAVSMLRRPDLTPEVQQRYLDILEQEYQRLNSFITRIVTLQMLGSQELGYDSVPVNLRILTEELAQSFRVQWEADTRKMLILNIEYDQVPESVDDLNFYTLYTDPIHLKVILVELLDNAQKFSTPQTVVSLHIRRSLPDFQPPSILLALRNQSPKIDANELEHLFEPFQRGSGVTEQSIAGTGLGLALAKELVELLNGRITMNYQACDAPDLDQAMITFTLTIPLSLSQPSV